VHTIDDIKTIEKATLFGQVSGEGGIVFVGKEGGLMNKVC
jgi:hypothetical protein